MTMLPSSNQPDSDRVIPSAWTGVIFVMLVYVGAWREVVFQQMDEERKSRSACQIPPDPASDQ
ncbi:hypothetical protein FIBSPDRAFT_852997 [Athelia psychrophila]|uniref:Uncharacterized protein n=1 Tax=Athelia psychrophila TaxID=1759441 RepID=A0A166RE81_9AGAM|nr:hypothetical protein FIBSPDRAFT_852997 [Fibularhizoctonia sp. CBS 109695]